MVNAMLLAFFGYLTWILGLCIGFIYLCRVVTHFNYLNKVEELSLSAMQVGNKPKFTTDPDSSHPEIAEIQKGDELIGIAFDGALYPPLPEDEEEINDNKAN
jgi:hypothetical protein